jgi:hypothetical protein
MPAAGGGSPGGGSPVFATGGRELGRISGPLLADNLKRNGSDIAVETQLLYLDVKNKYIGINTNIPTREFLVNGLTNTINQIVDTQADLGYFTINTSTIQNINDAINLIPSQANIPTIAAPKIQGGQLVLSTNAISNTTTNSDINLSPNGTGLLISNKSVLINGDLHATGNVTFDGNVTIGDGNTDSVTFGADVVSNIIPDVTNTYDLGSGPSGRNLTWRTLYANTATLTTGSIGEFTVTNNVISISTTNQSMILSANAAGIISIPTNSVSLGQNLTVTGTLLVKNTTTLAATGIIGTVNISGTLLDGSLLTFDSGAYTLDSALAGAYNQTGLSFINGTFANNNIAITGTSSYIAAPNFKIQNNVISNTTVGNADITLSSTGTGSVVLESLSIKNNRISNTAVSPITNLDKSVVISPTKTLVVNSTRFVKIPYSNNSDQVLTSVGNVRLNRTTGLYEGYQSYGFDSFNNVYNVSRTTSITAELTPGNNDKTIRFTTNGIANTTMTSTGVTANRLDAGNVSFISNIISNKISTNNVNLSATGLGKVNLNNIQTYASTGTTSVIKNTTTDAITTFVNQGTGFVRFAGTTAVTLPVGTTIGVGGRPTVVEIGMTRFNTTLDKIEIYTGNPTAGDNGWIPISGVAGAQLSQAEVTDILNIMAIVMG